MTSAEFAMMADPVRNPQFRRPWTGPPLEEEVARRSPSREAEPTILNKTTAYKGKPKARTRQARLLRAAERLFAPRVSA